MFNSGDNIFFSNAEEQRENSTELLPLNVGSSFISVALS
jgi:hypothetical protein